MVVQSLSYMYFCCYLLLKVKPKFVVKPNSTRGYEGYSLQIDCHAIGDPKPTITWISRPINDDPQHFIQYDNGTLFIPEVKASDAGKYQCIAGSDAGLNTAEITLTVQSRSTLYFSIAFFALKLKEG